MWRKYQYSTGRWTVCKDGTTIYCDNEDHADRRVAALNAADAGINVSDAKHILKQAFKEGDFDKQSVSPVVRFLRALEEATKTRRRRS